MLEAQERLEQIKKRCEETADADLSWLVALVTSREQQIAVMRAALAKINEYAGDVAEYMDEIVLKSTAVYSSELLKEKA